MKVSLWTIIPAILVLTSIYLALGNAGNFDYTSTDFIIGNILVILFVISIYIGEYIYNAYKEKNKRKRRRQNE